MDAITFDQLRTFLFVARTGGFSSAARAMGRSQSAVTYMIARLEDQTGLALFDRTAYRPALTSAGQALVPRAQRIVDDFKAFNGHALSIAGGLETELSLVLDPVFPMPRFLKVMRAIRDEFPQVRTRVYTESMGAGAMRLSDRTCNLGIGVAPAFGDAQFERMPLDFTRLTMVTAPDHPLARLERKLLPEDMGEHVQLVLTDLSEATKGRDFSVFSDHTWRLGDLGTKHALLLGGLGFGTMPEHWVEADISAGRLVRITPDKPEWEHGGPTLPLCVAWLKDVHRGPACLWLIQRLLDGIPEG